MSSDDLAMYVVYHNPSDFPGKYVVRMHTIEAPGKLTVTNDHFVADSLEEARANIAVFADELERPLPVVCLGRDPNDDKVIVETWL